MDWLVRQPPQFGEGVPAQARNAKGAAHPKRSQCQDKPPNAANPRNANRPACGNQQKTHDQQKEGTNQQPEAHDILAGIDGENGQPGEVEPGKSPDEGGEENHPSHLGAFLDKDIHAADEFESRHRPKRNQRPGKVGKLAGGVENCQQQGDKEPDTERDDTAAVVHPAANHGKNGEENSERLVNKKSEEKPADGHLGKAHPTLDESRDGAERGAQPVGNDKEEGAGEEEGGGERKDEG